jgi:DNA-binding MarR family transcriptional regulator
VPKRSAGAAGPDEGPDEGRGEAIADLLLEVAQVTFRLHAAGKRLGLVTHWGAGAFGFLRRLVLHGPLSVPQIAEMRPTSRQRMQRLADELAAEGLVAFVDNPRHRRSKLVRLTPAGEARYREMRARLVALAASLGDGFSEAEMRRAQELVRQLGDELKPYATGSER